MSELDSKALEAATDVALKYWSGIVHSVLWRQLHDTIEAAITAYLSALPAPATQEVDELREDLTRPIIGIESRTAQEAFDIMCDRIRSAPNARPITSYEIVDLTGCLHTTIDPKHAEELRQALMRPQLHEDTARLDWLEMQSVKVPSNFWAFPPGGGTARPSDLRAQIDRARAAEKDAH